MSSPTITAEVTIKAAGRVRRFDFGIYQKSPRKWRSGDWRGYGASDHANEAEARAKMAAVLREWADHIEKSPFPKET